MFFNKKIYLISQSKTRINLLKKVGFEVKTLVNNFNEDSYHKANIDNSALEDSLNLSTLKINNYLQNYKYTEDTILVGCDQTAICNNIKLNKAKDIKQANDILKNISNKTITLYSSFSVYMNNKFYNGYNSAEIKIKELQKKDIEIYLNFNKDIALSCLGCIDFEGKGIHLVEKVLKGDYYTILGFPVIEFLETLNKIKNEK